MTERSTFFRRLFGEGRLVLEGPPAPADDGDSVTLAELDRAFVEYRLTLAGPLLPFEATTARAAARLLERAAWFLFSATETEQEMQQALHFPQVPASPGQHLSGDLLFRYLPAVLRRARANRKDDRLVTILTDLLRRWPLSGVLADLGEGPCGTLDFGGHPGLQLLYAERLAQHFQPAWVPPETHRGYLELVWTEQGKDLQLLENPGKKVGGRPL